MKRVLILSILILTLAVQDGWARVPETMSYQGRLTDDAGKIVSNGNYSLTFNLYDDDIGGTLLWSENHSFVAVTKGIFSVILGSRNPLSLPFDQQYWLSVIVGGGGELSSRIQLASSAYSLNTRSVADGAVTADKIAANAVTTGHIQNGAVETNDLANGAVTATKIGTGQVLKSLNLLTDDVILIGGNNVTIVKNSANRELTISSAFSLPNNSVMSNHILDGEVDTNDLANGAVTATKIGTGQVLKSLNLLTDDVILIGGNNVTIIKNSANRELTISSAFSLSNNSVLSNHIGDGEVDTSDLADGAITTDKIAANAVDKGALKTALSFISHTTPQGWQTYVVTGGSYCFYPQVYVPSKIAQAWGCEIYSSHNPMAWPFGNDFTTTVSLSTGSVGINIQARFRYITASGQDYWIFILYDRDEDRIVGISAAPDHCSYGNGGSVERTPHPFGSYYANLPDNLEIILVDKETTESLRNGRAATEIVELLHNEYRPDFTGIEEYEPLHSGTFLGKEPVMIETIPDYIKVRKLIPLTKEEKKQKLEERQQMELASQQAENEKKQKIAELKKSLGITDEQFELLMQIAK